MKEKQKNISKIIKNILIICIITFIVTITGISIYKAYFNENIVPDIISEPEKTIYNNSFISYEGNQNGNNVVSLLEKIISSNEVYSRKMQIILRLEDEDVSKGVFGPFNDAKNINEMIKKINKKEIYNVTFLLDKDGWCALVEITNKT